MSAESARKTALLLGGTGATGKMVFEELKANELVSKILFLTRRDVEQDSNPKVEYKKVDFDKLDEHKEVFGEADVAFCCLGTTRGKSGKEGFIKVDYDYVVNSAKLLKEGGRCNNYHLVSSQGAKANSWFLYLGTKGKAEEAVKALGFDRVSVYRPGVLLTAREESRMLEKCAQSFFSVVDSGSSRSMPVPTLAKAIVNNAFKTGISGNETLESADILKAAMTAGASTDAND